MPPAPSPHHDDHPRHDHEPLRDRFEHLKDRVEEAAIAAELDTGEREETLEEAKAHALVRVARMTLGFLVVIIGIAALPLPGPGWLIIAGGLTILAKDVAWADRLLRYIRKRVPGVPEDGKIPRSSLVTMGLITLAFVSASLWWTFARGSDEFQAGTYVATELSDPILSVPVANPGIEVDLPGDGPVTLRSPSCDPVDLVVTDRSKAAVEVDAAVDPSWTCDDANLRRFVESAGKGQLQLGYSTDGLVSWFLADNQLSTITTTDDAGPIELKVAAS